MANSRAERMSAELKAAQEAGQAADAARQQAEHAAGAAQQQLDQQRKQHQVGFWLAGPSTCWDCCR